MNCQHLVLRLVAAVGAVALVIGCAAGPPATLTTAHPTATPTAQPTQPPTATPTAQPTAQPTPTPTTVPTASASAPTLTMVTISDSALGLGDGVAAAQAYADLLASDLGVRVAIKPLFYGGSSSGYILDRIRTIAPVRAAISSADVIVFDVPIGELKDLCPWDAANYQPAPGTAREYAACGATMVDGYSANARAIMDEITALADANALIRVINLWDYFYPRFQELGLGRVAHKIFTNISTALVSAAADHGIPVADARTAFMGANGNQDPVAAGFIQPDELHVTQLGADRLGQLLFDLGHGNMP